MKTSSPTPRRAAALLAAGLLSTAGLAGAALAEPRLDLLSALKASEPQASLGDAAEVFGRLVGNWSVVYLDITKDGKTTRRTGQFIVEWVLDGRAVQDVWIVDPSGARTTREVYTALHWFDPKSRTWPAVFVDPEHGSVAKFTGEAEGDRIVLHSSDLGAADSRWSFLDIRRDTFTFRDEVTNDGGKTWRLRSEDHMTRRAPDAPAP
jgi:hypothetical protein